MAKWKIIEKIVFIYFREKGIKTVGGRTKGEREQQTGTLLSAEPQELWGEGRVYLIPGP